MVAQLENASLDMISQRISNYFVELKTERDDLMNQLHALKDEIELYRHKGSTVKQKHKDTTNQTFFTFIL